MNTKEPTAEEVKQRIEELSAQMQKHVQDMDRLMDYAVSSLKTMMNDSSPKGWRWADLQGIKEAFDEIKAEHKLADRKREFLKEKYPLG